MPVDIIPPPPIHRSGVQEEQIHSFDDPALVPYRTMKRQQDHEAEGIFVAEGDKVTRRLIESAIGLVSLLVPPGSRNEFLHLLGGRPELVRMFVAEKAILEQLTGFPLYQGVLAVGRIPALPNLEALVTSFGRDRFFAAVDGLANAENLGALIRNCVALGAQAVIVGETCASPYLRRSVRSSMGTIFKIPVVFSRDLARDLRSLEAAGIRCVAAHPHTDRLSIASADLRRDCCVVFGSEGNGIRPSVLEACSLWAAVPMLPGVDSLNVASASAVFLYEVARQRGFAHLG